MTTFIKRYQFDDDRLRDRALLEFTRGLRDGRMIALTGAMTTQALGYFSWKELCAVFVKTARDVRGKIAAELGARTTRDRRARDLLTAIDFHCRELESGSDIIDKRVHFGMVREALDGLGDVLRVHSIARNADSENPPSPRQIFNQAFARKFLIRNDIAKAAAVRPLLEALGIVRFVTLNYDFEIERALMLRRDERQQLHGVHEPDGGYTFQGFVGARGSGRQVVRDRRDRLSRVNGDGLSTDSDIMERERVDRLIEFAVGSANIDRHILHLHGRADRPETMVLDIRDYDRLYRRDDLFKNPFEHGRRLLFAGNPVLFVGVGMSEKEVNETLEQFVSDSPYRRAAPAFLLWNTARFAPAERERQKKLKRIDFLQRLGVFVIFDDDLVWPDDAHGPDGFHRQLIDRPCEATRIALDALRATIAALPAIVHLVDTQGDRVGDAWRDTRRRAASKCERPQRLWGTPRLAERAEHVLFVDDDAADTSGDDSAIRVRFETVTRAIEPPKWLKSRLQCGLAAPGFGRGLLAEWLVQNGPDAFGQWHFDATRPCDRLLVNAGFSYDSDALLSGIADFLWERRAEPPGVRRLCRERLFAEGTAFATAEPVLIVINGIDRFFGLDGAPLSAELDHLIRCILTTAKLDDGRTKVQWLLFGTERVRRYLDALGLVAHALSSPTTGEEQEARRTTRTAPDPALLIRSRYLRHVANRFAERAATFGWPFDGQVISPAALAKLHTVEKIGRDAERRAFFSAYLAPATLGHFLECPVAFEVLRAMAFIGWPVEVHVLLHVPRVSAILDLRAAGSAEQCLLETITTLRELALVTEITRFDDDRHHAPGSTAPDPVALHSRFGLHRALATELRERHGVPLSEAKLSSTFNMSLFAAQPADDYMPEPQFHDELGDLVDALIDTIDDDAPATGDLLDPTITDAITDEVCREIAAHPRNPPTREAFLSLCTPSATSRLRAGMAVIRGYYATSNLLSIDCDDRLADATRDGALTEHADRLDRLLTQFGRIATARRIVRGIVGEAVKTIGDEQREERRSALLAPLGPEPFYPDDLVWLHNERGVVKLAQGDLYAARRSFSLALKANNTSLEEAYRGHNWRRITLNMVGLLIERGRLRSAEARLDEIEATIDQAQWARMRPAGKPSRGRVARILHRFGEQAGFIDDCSSRDFTREEVLMAGLVTGYRGLISQHQGHEKTAKGLLERAISILRRLGEQRSYALFQRHYASLRLITRDPARASLETDLAIGAADAAHQMDMAYRARLLRAEATRRSEDAAGRRQALDDINRALTYAALTDSHRVRIEAASALARLMLANGEFDAALKHGCDAMAVACRFGHSLHKIALRVQIGDILIQRGDPKSGNALLDEALSLSARTGYRRIVERVQRARRNGERGGSA